MLNKHVVKYDMKHKDRMGPGAHLKVQYPYGEETNSYQVSIVLNRSLLQAWGFIETRWLTGYQPSHPGVATTKEEEASLSSLLYFL